MIYRNVFKPVLDSLLAATALLVLVPVMLLVAVAIWGLDGWPVLFVQQRTGLRGREFPLLKFRSMIRDASRVGPEFTAAGDSRITPLGRFLRRSSLDELPQLFNVLIGQMSLVGPRPDTVALTKTLPPAIAARRWSVRPGITGWAQVNGRSSVTPEVRIRYDLEYVDRLSLMLDLRVLVRTVRQVLSRTDGSW